MKVRDFSGHSMNCQSKTVFLSAVSYFKKQTLKINLNIFILQQV